MNMKRGLVLCTCALAAMICSARMASAQNSVVVSLDIYFNNGNDNTTGGTWQLLAKVTAGGAQGLAGLNTHLTNTTGAADAKFKAPTPAFKTAFDAKTWTQDQDASAATLDMLFGQVPVAAPGPEDLQYQVGIAPFNNPDELGTSVDTTGTNMASAVTLAFGKFGNGVTPAFSGTTAANVFTAAGNGTTPPAVGSIVSATVTTQTRTNAATLAGDATLDKAVTQGDITRVLGNFNTSPGNKLWQEGDVTGDGNVTQGDITRVLGNFGHTPAGATAIAAPEPAAGLLAILGLGALTGLRKRD
jgi:hypothetical protein